MGKPGRPKLSADDETVRLVVRVPASDRERIEWDAAKAGLTVPEWMRRAIDRTLEVAGEGENRVGANNQSTTSPSRSESRAGAAKAAGLRPVGAILNRATHEHVAGKPLSGGINPCSVAGCQARKVSGRWVVV